MKVLFARLFPRQFESLKTAYTGPHQIEYVDQETPAQVQARARSADKVVVLSKFISHSHWDVIPREKVIHADSVNIDRMVHLLEQLPDDTPTQQAPKREPVVHTRVVKTIIPEKPPMSTSTTREVGDFILTTAVPIPQTFRGGRQGSKMRYPFEAMRIGESFFIDEPDLKKRRVLAAKIAASYRYFQKQHPERAFKTSVLVGDGVRCWRLPDIDPNTPRKTKRVTKKRQH